MVTITLKNGKVYPLIFDINVMEQIQEKYTDINLLNEKIKRIKELKYVLTLLINEYIDYQNYEHGTNDKLVIEKYIGMQMNISDLTNGTFFNAVSDALLESMGNDKIENNDKGEVVETIEPKK